MFSSVIKSVNDAKVVPGDKVDKVVNINKVHDIPGGGRPWG